MIFYQIRLAYMPTIRFACSATVDVSPDNCNIIDHRKDMLELSFNENIDMNVEYEWGVYKQNVGELLLYMPDCRYVITPYHSARMTSNSIAVEVPGLDFHRHDLCPEEAAILLLKSDADTFFLPQITSSDEREQTLISSIFKSIINHYAAGTTSERMMALSGWFELTALLDARFRELVFGSANQVNSGTYYVYKAKKYICSHLNAQLSLPKIADELGISSTYLCSLFKRETGQTIVDYINNQRCQRIRERIVNSDANFAEICREAGIYDRRHAQRLFKKYYRISMQRCRQLETGISLYHENPWKRNSIDHDIFGEPDPPPMSENNEKE